MTWTEEHIKLLKEQGKIKGYTVTKTAQSSPQKPINKKRKYRNNPVEVDGLIFDSIKEAQRWKILKLLLKIGKIGLLQRQVKYDLIINAKKICTYIADFVYIETDTGTIIVEDVKSIMTRKLSTYRLKKKLMLSLNGIDIKEI